MTSKELRRHQRILVPGEVEIRVAGNGKVPRVEGIATVIGLGGMFVRTKAQSPPGTVLNLALACPVTSFESECTVRNVEENGMGVEFTKLTPENQRKLEELLLELKA